ncbi:pilin [Acinetobacter sp. 251-1]|uniref:pilin n=1 Tax=Acinetobacter sp. 251-1 TaxID=2746720 RepID=UPI0025761C72|nr:pilin [Acinetobacter sp. 251-1]MDM1760972.1 pilin [Acinetobacter sp. 251-1]
MNTMQKGFTLIELMIVVAIIGILAAIAIPQYQNYIAKSQVSRVMSEAGSVKTAIETCLNDGKTAVGDCPLGITTSNIQTIEVNAAAADSDGNNGAALTETTAIVATFGNNAAQTLKATPSTLTWVRDATGSWRCHTTAAEKYRPASCSASI